jgi:hypothetical protein
MSKDALVAEVKRIVTLARSGNVEGSFEAYAALFVSPAFMANRPEDQRQALRLFVLAKREDRPSAKLLEAYRAAIPALTELVSTLNEPEDFEMLGVCHLTIGNEDAASNMFRHALGLERARNPASDLCGRLMTRIAAI